MNRQFADLLKPYLPYLGSQALTPESRLRDLGLDSMKAIDLLFAIEDTLDISLPDEDLNDATFATAGSLWRAVAAAGGLESADAPAAGNASPHTVPA